MLGRKQKDKRSVTKYSMVRLVYSELGSAMTLTGFRVMESCCLLLAKATGNIWAKRKCLIIVLIFEY